MGVVKRRVAVPGGRTPEGGRWDGPDADRPLQGAGWFWPALCVIVVLGIGLRVAFAAFWATDVPLRGDAPYFQQTASALAAGHGYVRPVGHPGITLPTAGHPPFFPAVLASLDLVGIRSVDAHRIALAFISSLGIIIVALLGRRVAGAAAGLGAAGVAAFNPLWVQPGGFLLSESVYLVVIPVMLLTGVWALERPRPLRVAVFGTTVGIATLTRSEAVLFVPVFALIFCYLARQSARQIGAYILSFAVGVGVVLGPWAIRNELRMGGFVLSTNSGGTLFGSYTTRTFTPSSSLYGGYDFVSTIAAGGYVNFVIPPPRGATTWSEVALDAELRDLADQFAQHHFKDLPRVVLAREGRTWGVYRLGSSLDFDVGESRNADFQRAGQYLNLLLLPLAAAGTVLIIRRSRRAAAVLLAPLVVVAVNVAIFYGSTRM